MARSKTPKYPSKIESVINLLIEQGYFSKEKEIVNIALLEYFTNKGFFVVLRKVEADDE